MVKKVDLTQWVYTLAAFVLVGGGLLGVLWLFAKAIDRGATVLAAILAAGATVVGAFVVRYWDRKKDGEAARREQLGPLYLDMAAVMAGHGMTDRKREKMILGFMRKSLVYSSPAVLKAFRDWRQGLSDEDDPPPAIAAANMLRYEVMVKAMRKDLGTSNFGMDEGDLLRAALTDFDEYAASGALEPPEGEPTVSSTTRDSSSRSA